MKKLATFALAAALLVAVTAPRADAALITFETSGVFESTGTDWLTSKGITLTFAGVHTTLEVSETGEFSSFGRFDVTGGNASTGGLGGETFLLTLTQIHPSGDVAFSSTLGGQINRNRSNATLTFAGPLSKDVFGFLYTIGTSPIDLPTPGDSVGLAGHIRQLDAGGSDETPQIVIPEDQSVISEEQSLDSQIPEPGMTLMFTAGLAGAALRLRRRKLLA